MSMIDGVNRHVRSVVRISEIRGVLTYLIKEKKLIHYAALADIFGRIPDKSFMDDLAVIARHDYIDGRPLSTAIVFGKRNMPSTGFFDHAHRIGALRFVIDREKFWLEQLNELNYDIVAMANGNTTEEFPTGLAALAETVIEESDVCADCGFRTCVCPDDPEPDDEDEPSSDKGTLADLLNRGNG